MIEGVPTTIPFEHFLIETPEFVSGNYDTNLIERLMKGGYFEQQSAIRKEIAK